MTNPKTELCSCHGIHMWHESSHLIKFLTSGHYLRPPLFLASWLEVPGPNLWELWVLMILSKISKTVLGTRKFSEKNWGPRHTKLTDIFGFLLYTAVPSHTALYGDREYCLISHRSSEESSSEVECFLYEMPQKTINNSVLQTGFKSSTVNKTWNNILESEEKHKKCIVAH